MDAAKDMASGLNLAERIRRLANGRTTLDVAQFQFIGIADIRARYGERWREKHERVVVAARDFISRRLGQDDVLIAGADGFLLVFGAFTGYVAEAAARQISKELNAFFIGEPELDDIQIESTHHAMSLEDFTRAFSAMMAEVRATKPAVEPPREPTTASFPMGYIPLWDAQRGALATQFISPLDPVTRFPLVWDNQSHRHAAMDERKLVESETDMRALYAGGARAVVGVAVHVSTLNNLQSLPVVVRQMARFDRRLSRYRVLRISCVEPGYPRIYLEDAMRAVRPHTGRIAIGLNWNEPDIGGVLKLRPAAIGFGIPTTALVNPGAKAEVFARVAAAVEQARAAGVMVSVEGDLHAEHAARFVRDGVNFLCSPRLWPVRPKLTAAETWPVARLDAMARAEAAA
jgi:hypothetical protein